MADRGRPAGFKMSQEHRSKISKSKIFSNLIKFAEGDDSTLSPAQAQVGLALLKKVMPDMQTIDPDTGKAGVTINLPDGSMKA